MFRHVHGIRYFFGNSFRKKSDCTIVPYTTYERYTRPASSRATVPDEGSVRRPADVLVRRSGGLEGALKDFPPSPTAACRSI